MSKIIINERPPFQHICVLTSVEDIWLRTAEEIIRNMYTAGIESIVPRYIFPNVNEEGLSPENNNRIREVLKGLHNEARSKYD